MPNSTNLYLPPSNSLWQGRPDVPPGSCFYQIIKLLDLNQAITKPDKPSFALIGFRCDEGIRRNLGRTGAAEGPLAIREILAKLPVQKKDFYCYDAGDIVCEDNDLETAQTELGNAIHTLLKNGITPIVLGGGHELAWGHFQGIAKQYPKENLGIVNFDAHFDMRPLLANNKGSSGTPFLQIAEAHNSNNRRFDYNCFGIQNTGNIGELFKTARNNNAQVIYADDIHLGETQKAHNFVHHVVYYNQIIYLSLCLDVFASAYAPGVSAPQALGLTPWQVIPYVRKLAASGKVVSYDLAELSPKYDIDQRSAKLAANLIFEIIHHHITRQ